MEHLAEVLASLSALGAGALAWKVKDMAEEIKSLRASRHEHGNLLNGHEAKIMDIERDVLRLRDGKNGGHR